MNVCLKTMLKYFVFSIVLLTMVTLYSPRNVLCLYLSDFPPSQNAVPCNYLEWTTYEWRLMHCCFKNSWPRCYSAYEMPQSNKTNPTKQVKAGERLCKTKGFIANQTPITNVWCSLLQISQIFHWIINIDGFVFNWNHFEMRLLNLRINFYLLRTFYPHLGRVFFCCFFFHYVSAKFHLWPSSGDLPRPRIGMLSLVTISPVITAFHSCCLSHHFFWPSKPLAGLGRIWNRYLLTMLTWNRRDSTPLSAAPRASICCATGPEGRSRMDFLVL